MEAAHPGGSGRQEEHIAVSEKLFGTLCIENRTRVDLRRDLIRDPGGEVRLDDAGDDVDGRALRRDDQMDADGARLLSKTSDGVLHVLRGDHHQIRELVDDHDDVLHPHELGEIFLADTSPANGLVGILDHFIELRDVPYPATGQEPVSVLHLLNRPEQGIRRELRIGHDGMEEMRNILVHLQLDHLRIDHQDSQILRHRLVQKRDDHRVQPDGLTRTGRAGDEQMRHLRKIGHHGLAVNVLAQSERQKRFRLPEYLGVDDVAERDQLPLLVGNLDSDRRRPGNAFDPDRLRLEREREIVGEIDDLRVLHTGRGLELERGDDRSGMVGGDLSVDREFGTALFDQPARVHVAAMSRFVDLLFPRPGLQEIRIREPLGRERSVAGGRLRLAVARLERRRIIDELSGASHRWNVECLRRLGVADRALARLSAWHGWLFVVSREILAPFPNEVRRDASKLRLGDFPDLKPPTATNLPDDGSLALGRVRDGPGINFRRHLVEMLADDLVLHALFPPALGQTCPMQDDLSPERGERLTEAQKDVGETDSRGEEQSDDRDRDEDDSGTDPVEVRRHGVADLASHVSPRRNQRPAIPEVSEYEVEQRRKRDGQDQQPEELRLEELDLPAPETIPSHDQQGCGKQEAGETEKPHEEPGERRAVVADRIGDVLARGGIER